jgi:hypothetical protein
MQKWFEPKTDGIIRDAASTFQAQTRVIFGTWDGIEFV